MIGVFRMAIHLACFRFFPKGLTKPGIDGFLVMFGTEGDCAANGGVSRIFAGYERQDVNRDEDTKRL